MLEYLWSLTLCKTAIWKKNSWHSLKVTINDGCLRISIIVLPWNLFILVQLMEIMFGHISNVRAGRIVTERYLFHAATWLQWWKVGRSRNAQLIGPAKQDESAFHSSSTPGITTRHVYTTVTGLVRLKMWINDVLVSSTVDFDTSTRKGEWHICYKRVW